jgi:C_GCAxxG_C_C family probable redox protein
MEANDHKSRAVAYFQEGFLCSQSILMTFADQLGMDLQAAARIAAPFGAGLGRKGWTCGAVTGAMMVIGMRHGHDAGNDDETKERMFEMTQAFMTQFEQRNGSVVCRQLLGRDLSKPGELEMIRAEGLFESRCPQFVADAAEILETYLERDD